MPVSVSAGCPGSGRTPGRWHTPPRLEGGKEAGVTPPGLMVPVLELQENTG